MLCPNCKEHIPQNAIVCNYCDTKTGQECAKNNEIPNEDMFGNTVTKLEKMSYKKQARMRRLDKLQEYKDVQTAKNIANDNLCKLFMITGAVIFLLLPLVLKTFSEELNNWQMVGVFIIALAIIIPVFIYLYKNICKDSDEKIEFVKFHSDKTAYYYSSDVFGFSVWSYTTKNGTKCFSFYEIDKRDIIDVSYDNKFEEYILYLSMPVYIDYKKSSSNEFRIADIFNKDELFVALGIKLPN